MTDGPLITLQDVTIGYDRQVVRREIGLRLARGSFTALLGANGSGKSTLLKTILGVLPPLAGKVQVHPINGREPVYGYVPQRRALDPIYPLSGFEVVLMSACARVGPGRVIGKEERDWAENCLEQVGAGDLGGKRFSELSGGQKQRVLLARALATRPDLLALDEPTAGVDTAAARAILDLLQHLHAGPGMTVLMVNHDLALVRHCARHIIWLQQGSLVEGSVEELLTREKIDQLWQPP